MHRWHSIDGSEEALALGLLLRGLPGERGTSSELPIWAERLQRSTHTSRVFLK